MEIEKKEVIASKIFEEQDVPSIYEYGEVTFGIKLADIFYFEIINSVRSLEAHYLLHPECRHLETKTKMYHNIILGSYLIIYRIKAHKIEILRDFHGSRSPKYIKAIKKITV